MEKEQNFEATSNNSDAVKRVNRETIILDNILYEVDYCDMHRQLL
jgi:hypothetical protein